MKQSSLLGERLIWRVNRHWLVPAGNLLVSAPLMFAALIATVGLADSLGQPSWPVALLVASVITATWFGAAMLAWASTGMTLTTHRVIVQRGVLRQVRIAVPYDRIQAVDIRQNLAGRIFGYGTVELVMVTSNGPVAVSHLPLRGLREHLMRRVMTAPNPGNRADERAAM